MLITPLRFWRAQAVQNCCLRLIEIRKAKPGLVAGSALGNLFPLLIHGQRPPYRWPRDQILLVTKGRIGRNTSK
jgi:hypothetical protein